MSLIAALAAAPDGEPRARLLHESARVLLADPPMTADIAVMASAEEDTDETHAAAVLLSVALDEARMARENAAPEGCALIEAVDRALAARDASAAFPPAVRLRLAQIYARAGLVPPPVAQLTVETMGTLGTDTVLPGDMSDIAGMLGTVIRDVGDEPLQVHAALGELFAGLPVELGAILIATAVARPGTMEARLGLYWLLDPQPPFRLAAATALLQRAEAGALPPDMAALLPTIRKWLPDDPARNALDATIRQLMRDGAARAGGRTVSIHRAMASLPDGAGAQSLMAAVQVGGQRGVAMVMLKQGHGVKDALLLPCASASEQKRMLGGVLGAIETFDIAPAHIAEAVSVGLGEGLALDLLPAPGLVDMVAIWGADALVPRAGDAEAILAAIGATEKLGRLSPAELTALIDASADWVEQFDQSDAWFEDTGPLRAAIGRARSYKGRETAVWKHLETRRDWWARQFAVCAATLKAETKPDPRRWLSFAAVAQALLDQRPLKRTPIMVEIMEMTLEAFFAREGDSAPFSPPAAPPPPRPEVHGEIAHLLAPAGIGEPYLQGYLTALVISPLEPSMEVWLGGLIGGIEFPGDGTLQRLVDVIMMRAERMEDDAADPATVGGWIAALDAAGLRDWAAGFNALVTASKPAWPAKALATDDRRVLKAIKVMAEGGDQTALRAILPAWVARRHAMRR